VLAERLEKAGWKKVDSEKQAIEDSGKLEKREVLAIGLAARTAPPFPLTPFVLPAARWV